MVGTGRGQGEPQGGAASFRCDGSAVRAGELAEPQGPRAHCYAVRMNGLRGACAVGLSAGEKQASRPGCGHMMGEGSGAR